MGEWFISLNKVYKYINKYTFSILWIFGSDFRVVLERISRDKRKITVHCIFKFYLHELYSPFGGNSVSFICAASRTHFSMVKSAITFMPYLVCAFAKLMKNFSCVF